MKENCNFCNGKGHQRSYQPHPFEALADIAPLIGSVQALDSSFRKKSEHKCPICLGSGSVEKPKVTFECPFCHGKGGFPHFKYKDICDNCTGLGWKEGNPNFLEAELSKKELPILNCYIVFIDIVKYSKRHTYQQNEIIKKLNRFINSTIENLMSENRPTFSKNTIDLYNDSILLPVGDGVVIGFPFDIIRNIHLLFATKMLEILDTDSYIPCDSFSDNGYCTDHSHFKIRIGIGKGDCLIYKDINRKYNFAGDEVNLTARVMSKAFPNEIVFTKKAHYDYTSFGGGLGGHFIRKDGEIKHEEIIEYYIYNSDPKEK